MCVLAHTHHTSAMCAADVETEETRGRVDIGGRGGCGAGLAHTGLHLAALREQCAEDLVEALQQQVELLRRGAVDFGGAAEQQRQVAVHVADGDTAERERRRRLDVLAARRQRADDEPLDLRERRQVRHAAKLAEQQQQQALLRLRLQATACARLDRLQELWPMHGGAPKQMRSNATKMHGFEDPRNKHPHLCQAAHLCAAWRCGGCRLRSATAR